MESSPDEPSAWPVQATLLQFSTPWLTLIGEQLLVAEHQTVDYWRVEKADSVIILPVWQEQVVVPPRQYRPGLGEVTLDLPGGRVAADNTPTAAAYSILERELGVVEQAISTLTPLNSTGWPVNSSFSNQRLFGFKADLDAAVPLSLPVGSQSLPFTPAGLRRLLQQITCLQCRAVILEILTSLWSLS